ncbi:MAG: hypothetical protein AB1716_13140 [Planctomycetota bacterium]
MIHQRTLAGLAAAFLWAGTTSAQEPKPAQVEPQAKPAPAQQHADRQDKQAEAPARPLCPIMEEPIDLTVKTMTADGPVYFCCDMCIPKYEKDPAKYAGKVKAQRAALAKLPKVQVACPVSGKAIDKKVAVEQSGEKIYFCCPDCPEKFKKDPAAFRGKLAASYTYQVKCPVSGQDIDPAAHTEIQGGNKVYFCCPKCISRFTSEPEKYAENLEKQGVFIDTKAMKKGAAPDSPEKKPAGE